MADGIPPPKEDQALGPGQTLRSSFYLALAHHGGAIVQAPTTNLRVLTRWLSTEGAGQIREASPRRAPVLLDPDQVAAITAALRDAIIDGARSTPSLTPDSSGGDDDDDDDEEIGHPNDQHIMFPRIESLDAGNFRLFFVSGSAPGLPDAPQGHGVSSLCQ